MSVNTLHGRLNDIIGFFLHRYQEHDIIHIIANILTQEEILKKKWEIMQILLVF